MPSYTINSTTLKKTLALSLLSVLLVFAIGTPLTQAREVNIYSYRQPFLIKPLLTRFTQETGIKTNVVFAPKGLIERLKREGRHGPADLLLTSDIGRLHDAVEAGVVQSVRSDILERNVPASYRHGEGLWFGLTLRARVIFASKARVPRASLSTYADLADPKWEGRICSRSSQHVYNIALLASMVAHQGKTAATEWAKGFYANLARKPQGNDRAQVRAIYSGECDLALVNTYYMGKMMDDPKQVPWAESVYVYFPDAQGNGAHVNISGGAVTASARNKAEATALLEFLSNDWAQGIYAAQNHEYPVKPGVKLSDMVASWGTLKPDTLPLEEVAKHRREAILIFDRLGFP